MKEVKLTVNGEQQAFPAPLTGGELLAALSIPPSTAVAELNGTVVPIADFSELTLADGDAIELVTLVGGG